MYNEVVNRFLIYHEINPDSISKKVDTKLYSKEYFLGVLSSYIIYKPQRIEEVSIGDIYGYNFDLEEPNVSIFELLNSYFKEDKKKKVNGFGKKQDYFNRSNENIFLSSNQMIEKSNNCTELITVNRIDIDNNINLIYTNGMHRFLLLKIIYLKMISLFPDKIDEIKEKFKLKVSLSEIDEIKTFCFFIMDHYYSQINKVVGYKLEYEGYKMTGRIKIGIGENDEFNEHFIFNDDELIEFVKPMISQDLDFYKSINIESFKRFMISIGFDYDKEYKKIKESI